LDGGNVGKTGSDEKNPNNVYVLNPILDRAYSEYVLTMFLQRWRA